MQGRRARSPSAASRCRSRSSASRSTTACASSCAASRAAGGGSYVDVDDADQLGDELSGAALARVPVLRADRAPRSTGGPTPDQAIALGTGLFQDDPSKNDATERWFAIDVPEGRRLVRLGDGDPAAGLGRVRGRSSSTCGPAGGDRTTRGLRVHPDARHRPTTSSARRCSRERADAPGDPPGRVRVHDADGAVGDGHLQRGHPGRDRGVDRSSAGDTARADRAGQARDAHADARRRKPRATATRRARPRRTRARSGPGCSSPASAWPGSPSAGSPPRVLLPQGGGVRRFALALALALALAAPAAAQDRGDAGRRRRLVQQRADPRARDASTTRSCPPSTSTTASGSRPGSSCASRPRTRHRQRRRAARSACSTSRSTSTRRPA